jgi:hypothetical protein
MIEAKLQGPFTDGEIQRSAAGMIQAYQGEAAGECEAIIARRLRRDDAEGGNLWRRILEAVEAV